MLLVVVVVVLVLVRIEEMRIGPEVISVCGADAANSSSSSSLLSLSFNFIMEMTKMSLRILFNRLERVEFMRLYL